MCRLISKPEFLTIKIRLMLKLPSLVLEFDRDFDIGKPDIEVQILALEGLELEPNLTIRHRLLNVPRESVLKVRF